MLVIRKKKQQHIKTTTMMSKHSTCQIQTGKCSMKIKMWTQEGDGKVFLFVFWQNSF